MRIRPRPRETLIRRQFASGYVTVPPTLSIGIGGENVLTSNISEGAGKIAFNVNSDVALSEAVTLRLTVTAHDDYGISKTQDVTIASASNTKATEIEFNQLNTAVGKREIVVALPSTVSGYDIDDTKSKVTFTIHDDENSKMTGPLYVVALDPASKVVQVAGKGTATHGGRQVQKVWNGPPRRNRGKRH